jgi:hypothetical protein
MHLVRYSAVRHHMAVARATLGARGRIQRAHIRYLGLHAFAKIFARKQSRHVGALRWGGCTDRIQLMTHSLKAPGFNP